MADSSPYLVNSDTALTDIHQSSFSIVFWVNPTPSAPNYVESFLIEDKAFTVKLQADGTILFSIFDSVTSTTTSVQSSAAVIGSQWNFAAVVYDLTNSLISVYVNDSSNSVGFSNPADSSVSSIVPDFQLGANDLEDTVSIDATFALDSVTVWARALTSPELIELYNAGNGLEYPFLGGPFTLIFQGNLINDADPKPLVLGSGFQLWEVDQSFDTTTGLFGAGLNLLYTGNQTTQGYVWHAANFNNVIVFAQHDNPSQFWLPPFPNLSRDLPGLPVDDDQWDGATVFFDHVLLWKGNRLKWSDAGDFTSWIPVANTAVSAVLNIEQSFVQPPPGGTVTVTVENPVAQVVSISLSGSLSFPSTAVGSTSQELLTIINTGTTPLVVSGISLPTGFTGSFSGTIPVGGSVPVVITFSPTAAITYIGTVNVASNATQGTFALPISGTGTGTTKIVALSGFLNFGTVVVGRSISSALVITNNGNTTLNVSSITLPGGYTGAFAGTIAAGASQDVTVTFHPTAKQAYTGNITVNSDATSGTGLAAVSGTGVASQPFALFITDNGSCQFGSVSVGSTPTGTLRIYNTGNQPFNVVGITLPNGFTGTFSGAIAAHSFHDVTITFSPIAAQGYGGLITVATNHASQIVGSNSITVSGVGVATGKVISLSGNLDFGGVPVNSTVQNILTISNVGDTAINVTSITYPDAVFSGNFVGAIPPGGSQNVLVAFSPTATGVVGGTLTVNSDATGGTSTFPISGDGIAAATPTSLIPGQFVSLIDVQNGVTYYNYYSVVSMSGTSLVLQLLNLTGPTPAGSVINAGEQILTVDANEAGEADTNGDLVNGPIFRVWPQGDYAYIMKERSIQTMSFVGQVSGTFFIRPAVSGEGLIARDASINLNDGRIVFLGHKELYVYTGGQNVMPVCQQFTRQLFAELDRTRKFQIIMHHNENRNEVWVQYPTIGGGFKVLIWNYVEDSAAIDIYDPSVVFTALNVSDWSTDPVWSQIPDSTLWSSYDRTIRWEDLVGASLDHITLMASADGNLRVFGLTYAREGQGYLALSETMDFSFDDWDIFKYVDVIVLGLQTAVFESTPRLLYVQVGSRVSLDVTDDKNIIWSDPVSILVNGQAQEPIKVNPGGAGRFLRLRFYSQDPLVQWRLSSYEIHCRPGNTY